MSRHQTGPILRRKDELHVACWNVRTLQDVGAQALAVRGLRKYNVEIACLSEIRVPDSGHSVLKVPVEEVCCHLYHSGVVDNSGRHVVAIALREDAQVALLARVPSSPRLASARMEGAIVNVIIIAVDDPTLNPEEVAKSPFYEGLQDEVDSSRRRHGGCRRRLERKTRSRERGNTAHPGQVCSGSEVW